MRFKEIEFATLQHNCKYYLQLNPEFETRPLYRGMVYQGPNKDFAHIIPRTNRQPRDSHMLNFMIMDKAFEAAGFVARTSNSLFATPNKLMASSYGDLYYIYPAGHFDYTWSPSILDGGGNEGPVSEWFDWDSGGMDYHLGIDNEDELWKLYERFDDKDIEFDEIGPYVNWAEINRTIISKYKKTDFQEAIRSNSEILIKCDSYYAVNTKDHDNAEFAWKNRYIPDV